MACLSVEIKICWSSENWCYGCHYIAFHSIAFHSYRVVRFSSVTKQLHLPAFLQKRLLEQEKSGGFGQRGIIMNAYALFPWVIYHLLCNALHTTCLSHNEGKQ